ncbi:hypothetical protein TNCV_1024891 [Trichonephila clavipes]|nr:hypothetical protein TNCV_1024891 [Trichonephila clavipes]
MSNTTVVTEKNEEVEEAVRESHSDALDIHERTVEKKILSTFLPDQSGKRVSKRREWSSDSFYGSVKEVKRVIQKTPRPPKTITSAKIHNEEDTRQIIQNQRNYGEKSDSDSSTEEEYPLIHRSKYVTSKNDQHTGIQTPKKWHLTQNSIDNNAFSKVHMSSVKKTKKRKLGIISDNDEASRQEKSPSKPENSRVRKGSSRFFKYLLRQKNSSVPEESSVKSPRVTVKYFEPGKSPSKPEFSSVARGGCKIPIEASGQEQSASKPELSCVTTERSTVPLVASGQEKSPSKPEHSHVRKRRSVFSQYLLRQEKSSSVPEESSVKRPRVTVKYFEPGKSSSRPEFSPVVRGRYTTPKSFYALL